VRRMRASDEHEEGIRVLRSARPIEPNAVDCGGGKLRSRVTEGRCRFHAVSGQEHVFGRRAAS